MPRIRFEIDLDGTFKSRENERSFTDALLTGVRKGAEDVVTAMGLGRFLTVEEVTTNGVEPENEAGKERRKRRERA